MKFENLTELSMALYHRKAPVGNDCDFAGKMLLIVTGANQGGKSTFLRSIGIAQIMLQSGMFVAAGHFESGISTACRTGDGGNISGNGSLLAIGDVETHVQVVVHS